MGLGGEQVGGEGLGRVYMIATLGGFFTMVTTPVESFLVEREVIDKTQ